jgi:hypothetical protein
MFSEKERLVNMLIVSRFNLNAPAALLVFEAYVKNAYPMPIRYVWKDVELTIQTAGYMGKRRGVPEDCDDLAMRLLMRSYIEQLAKNNLPVSFQLANAVEFHLRGKNVSDNTRNPLRNIFNPT